MKLELSNTEFIGSCEMMNDLSTFNNFTNRCSSKTIHNVPFPNGLIKAALQEMNGYCYLRFIDASKYHKVSVTKINSVWQVDFISSNDCTIQVFEIYYHEEKEKILQRTIQLN